MKKQTKYGIIFACIILVICGFWYKDYQAKEAVRLAVASETVIEEVSPLLTYEELQVEMDKAINNNPNRNKTINLMPASDSTNQYRIFTQRLFISDKYQPAITFYCQTTEEDVKKAIDKIIYIDFDRNYEGRSKAFHGDIFVNLESPNDIYYIVNGDFYDSGNTLETGTKQVALNQSIEIKYQIENKPGSKYGYKCLEHRFTFE